MDYFHAHIYWENQEQRFIAISLRDNLKELGCPLGQTYRKAYWSSPISDVPSELFNEKCN